MDVMMLVEVMVVGKWLKLIFASVPGELRCEEGTDDSTPLSCWLTAGSILGSTILFFCAFSWSRFPAAVSSLLIATHATSAQSNRNTFVFFPGAYSLRIDHQGRCKSSSTPLTREPEYVSITQAKYMTWLKLTSPFIHTSPPDTAGDGATTVVGTDCRTLPLEPLFTPDDLNSFWRSRRCWSSFALRTASSTWCS